MINGILIYDKERYIVNKWFRNHIIEKSRSFGMKISLVFDEDLYNFPLENIDFSIVRLTNPSINKYLEENSIRCFNNYKTSLISNDKLKTYEFSKKNNIKTMKTSCNVDDFSFPFVTKHRFGHGGNQVFLINNEKEKQYFLKNINDGSYIFQKLSTNPGYDLRVYVLGNTIIDAVLRSSKNDFRANYTLGGEISIVDEIDSYLYEDIYKITSSLSPDLIGIDFIKNKGRYIFNEIEDVVGTRMLYKLREYDIVEKYLTYIYKKIE